MKKHNDKTTTVLHEWITAQAQLREETIKTMYPIKPLAKCDRRRMPCRMRILDNHEFAIYPDRMTILAMRVEKIKRVRPGTFHFTDPFNNIIAWVKTGYPVTDIRILDAVHTVKSALETYGTTVPTSAYFDVARAIRDYNGNFSFGPSADTVNSYESKREQSQLPVFRGTIHPK